jgi:hypothetical protein
MTSVPAFTRSEVGHGPVKVEPLSSPGHYGLRGHGPHFLRPCLGMGRLLHWVLSFQFREVFAYSSMDLRSFCRPDDVAQGADSEAFASKTGIDIPETAMLHDASH